MEGSPAGRVAPTHEQLSRAAAHEEGRGVAVQRLELVRVKVLAPGAVATVAGEGGRQ